MGNDETEPGWKATDSGGTGTDSANPLVDSSGQKSTIISSGAGAIRPLGPDFSENYRDMVFLLASQLTGSAEISSQIADEVLAAVFERAGENLSVGDTCKVETSKGEDDPARLELRLHRLTYEKAIPAMLRDDKPFIQ